MALNFTRIVTGLKLKAKALLTSDSLGELEASTSDSKLHYHNGSVRSPVVTESSTATLTNKTIDANGTGNGISNLETADLAAGVLNTSTTLATASNTQVPSALAVKTYVDDNLALQNEASEISYNNATSGLIATNLQASTDEIVDMLDAHVTDPTDAHDASAISNVPSGNIAATDVQGALNEIQSNIDTNYTAFTDHVNDAVDAHDASAISVVPTGNLTATEAQAAFVEIQTSIDNLPSDPLTFSNKDLVDASTAIIDNVDSTVKLRFDIGGTSATTTTLFTAQTANRAIVLPDASTTLIGADNVQTIQNKAFTDSLNAFVDSSDPSKEIKFDVTGTTGTKTTIRSTQTADVVITLPNVTGTVVTSGDTGTVTSTMILNDTIVNADINTAAAIARSKLASGTNNALVANNGSGVLSDVSGISVSAFGLSVSPSKNFSLELADDATTTGVDASVTAFAGSALTFSNGSLTSIANIPAGSNGQELIIINRTNNPISIKDESDALGTASARIFTGTGATLTFADNAALFLTYDAIESRWQVIGGSGGGGGGASALVDLTDVNILTPVNSQVLTYDSATSTWRNRPVDKEPEVMEDLNFDYSLTTDFTQTGLAISTANPIRGVKSAQLISAGSTQSFKKVLAVDPEFRGKNNTISIYTRSSATQGNVTILIYDETNAANLAASQPITLGSTTITATTTSASATLSAISTTDINLLKVGQTITGAGIPAGTIISAIGTSTATMSQNASASATITPKISALPARQAFTFDIPNNCASLSYTISALAETGSPESYFDDITVKLTERVGTTASVTVPRKVATRSYTPVFTGFGTPTNIEFEYDEDGEYYNIRGKFTSGISTGTPGQVTLPNSAVTASGSLLPSIQSTSIAFQSVTGTNQISALIQPSVNYITFGVQSAGAAGLTPINASSFISNGQTMSFTARVPIANAAATESLTIPLTSSQLVQTPDSTIKLNTSTGYGSTATKVIRFTNIEQNLGNSIQYLSSSVNGDSFTALAEGLYNLSFSWSATSASDYYISKNQSNLTTTPTENETLVKATLTTATQDSISVESYLYVGDIVRAVTDGSPIGSRVSKFTMSYKGSLKQLNFSTDSKITIPTHQLRFEGASSRGSTDTAIVKFDTQAITQGDAWSVVNTAANGTVITMQKAGKLSVASSLSLTSTSELSFITKNQAVLTTTPVAAEIYATSSAFAGTATISMTAPIDVVVGDKIRICANGGITSNAVNNFTLSLTETSIPANFSNVLPQWSQSDSSVRLNTANGYGSTNTAIRRFTNTVDNLGSSITYSDSASLGASFLINEDGNYTITYNDVFSAGASMGLSKNTTQPTTNIASLTNVSERLAVIQASAANIAQEVTWSGYLAKNDVVRAHTDSTSSSANPNQAQFTISKVGKPNLSSVDVTSFVNMKTTDTEAIEALTATSTFGATNTGVPVLNITRNTNLGVIRVDSSAANGTSFVALKDCEINIAASAATNGSAGGLYLTKNSTVLTAAAPNGIFANIVILTTSTYSQTISGNILLKAGDTVRIQKDNANVNSISTLTLTATADNNATASPTQQVSSDTMPLVHKPTPINPDTDPIGTFNTWTYASGGNVATIAGTAPTQTTSSMNINGIQVFSRAGNATSTAASPARVDVFIGKGLSDAKLRLFKSTSKATLGSLDYTQADGKLDAFGLIVKDYNPTTGILQIDAGMVLYPTSNTTHTLQFSDATSQTNGYVDFNASKAPVLTTVPNLQMRVAYLSDVKASGTAGGSASATTTHTRTLNTLVDNTGIVTSLVSNQFVLPAGTYQIEASAPSLQADQHRARIRNITDGTTALLGTNEYSYAAGNVTQSSSRVSGEITITSSKTFELQHYTKTARATDGLGTPVTNGDTEMYSTVKITKIK